MFRKTFRYLHIIGLLAVLCAQLAMAAAPEEVLPEFSLPMPQNSEHTTYLGLTETNRETFTVTDIDADVVLIELFSMYCPYCQREAPNVNVLHEKMLGLPPDGPKVRIIGIGASNSQFEVDYFRDAYDISFPLFPDKEMEIYQLLHGDGTPGFIGVRLNKGQKPVMVLRNLGGFDNAETFLADLLQKAGY